MTEYRTPQALKQALEARQKARARAAGVPFDRIAQVDLYVRFLDRALRNLSEEVVVKGGVALELRLHRARTTADIDLRATGNPGRIHERLAEAGELDLGDHLRFDVAAREGADTITGDGVIYTGRRFRVTATFAGKKYRQPFGVDVGFGDPMFGAPDHVVAPDALAFAGIAAPTVALYPIGTHLAEKVHAYTLPRERVNGRMKDLIDLALVASAQTIRPDVTSIGATSLRAAFETTFAFRATHALPPSLPPPPGPWQARYPRDRDLNALAWSSLDEVYTDASRFLDPVLAGSATGVWDPITHAWR